MSEQDPRKELLREAAGIRVGVPYSATIKNDEAELSGRVIFTIADNPAWLTFKFYYEPTHPTDELGRTDLDTKLHIDFIDVCWNVKCAGFPLAPEFPTTTLTGWVKDRWFGSEVDGLTGLTVGYSGIPTGWEGNADFTYYEGYDRERLSMRIMSGIQLDYTDWSVNLGRVPDHHVVNGVRYVAEIHNTLPFSGCNAQQFVTDLHYFLCFLFGVNPGMVFAEGRKEYELSWGSLRGYVRQPPEHLATWYGKMHPSHDLSGIFTAFCGMGAEDKDIMSSMIIHYTASEEIITSGTVAIHHAIVASYSALEGLVRWISEQESDMPDRDKCFYSTRSGSWRIKDKRFARAVARVCEHLKLNNPRKHQALREQVRTLNDYRNDIAHSSDMHGSEGTQLYSVWNKSQCLVEALILRKLGFVGVIPNRTSLPVYEVRGEDVLKKRREQAELWLDAHFPPTRRGGSDG